MADTECYILDGAHHHHRMILPTIRWSKKRSAKRSAGNESDIFSKTIPLTREREVIQTKVKCVLGRECESEREGKA